MIEVDAAIHWLTPEEGGRAVPPIEGRYATIVRFEDDETWPEQKWTLVVRIAAEEGAKRRMIGSVGFLVEAAPHHVLRPGGAFELFEGARLVARGKILD